MSNIVSAGELCPRVKSVEALNDYKLIVTFNNGEKRLFNALPLLQLPVFKPLSNKEYFKSVRVEYGTIVWGDSIDYCPDTLYLESIELPLSENLENAIL